jgi:hypothetical protein
VIKFVDIPMQLHYDGVRWLILVDDNGICGCPCAGAWLAVLLSFILYLLSFIFYLYLLSFIFYLIRILAGREATNELFILILSLFVWREAVAAKGSVRSIVLIH